ncbi:hypothetical protein ACQKRQ_21895 [Paraburkholderia sp. NPDC080076]|uniref:hypothetical protein n=1 Tax=Paraburkholderia sp. NPDC080076 TaxID=3390605 RepID=UPI003D044C19
MRDRILFTLLVFVAIAIRIASSLSGCDRVLEIFHNSSAIEAVLIALLPATLSAFSIIYAINLFFRIFGKRESGWVVIGRSQALAITVAISILLLTTGLISSVIACKR